ncbi:unnamed protein product [Echinostoma caproni]|uniref:non-specific serine/threonine protein kinase n=1 Tax=Echinostoma caproni TaxID=27848 RepID=A0A3P8F6V4_9TREM|nr:unnamed protein product [Echinostoma caproni]
MGVLVYEMLYGDTPFYSETLVNTYAKIMSHAASLRFPENVSVSDSALDFMKQLLCDREWRLGTGPDGSMAVRSHAWFAPDWADSVREMFGVLDGADLSLTDWTWSNIRACRAPFQPNLTSETDTAYFPLDTDDEAQQHRNSHDPVHTPTDHKRSDPLCDSLADPSVKSKQSPETEAFLNKYPGYQLAFAGFSFSSSHPDHLTLLNGLHLAPRTISSQRPTADIVTSDAGLPNHKPVTTTKPILPDSNPDEPTNSSVHKTDEETELRAQLSQVESQLADILAQAELHANAVANLQDQLTKISSENRSLETELAQRDRAHRNAMEQAEQRLELVRSEAAADLARLEAEVAKWKTRERDELRELLETSEKACRRSHEDYEAARRALTEEQQRSTRYREATRIAEDNALAASHRATVARREVASLRDQLEQMTQAYAKEKLNFAATVNKLTEAHSHAQMLESRLQAAEMQIAQLTGEASGQPSHSRQNSDTVLGGSQRPGSVQLRSWPESYGSNRAKPFVIHSVDNGLIGQKPFGPSSTVHMASSISVYLLPSPIRILADPTDFTIHGVLELGVKHRGKKKLCWEPRVARLTMTHLVLSHYMPEMNSSAVAGTSSGTGPSLGTGTLSRQSRIQAVTTIFELPLTAIYHVRSINLCDLYHQPAEDVPRIFQLIYDRPTSGDAMSNGISSAATNQGPNSTKTLPAPGISTGQNNTVSPDRETICSPRSSRLMDDSSDILTADTVILMDTKDDRMHTESQLKVNENMGLEGNRVNSPGSTATYSNSLVVAHATQAPRSTSVSTSELVDQGVDKLPSGEAMR